MNRGHKTEVFFSYSTLSARTWADGEVQHLTAVSLGNDRVLMVGVEQKLAFKSQFHLPPALTLESSTLCQEAQPSHQTPIVSPCSRGWLVFVKDTQRFTVRLNCV